MIGIHSLQYHQLSLITFICLLDYLKLKLLNYWHMFVANLFTVTLLICMVLCRLLTNSKCIHKRNSNL